MCDIYIILINYNAIQDTIECLKSLKRCNYKNYRIIIIDNSVNNDSIYKFYNWAEDNTQEEVLIPQIFDVKNITTSSAYFTESIFANVVQEILPDNNIIYVKADNKGFAAANNIALNYLQNIGFTDYVWLLNNDTIVDSNVLNNFFVYINNLANNEKISPIGHKLFYYHKPDLLQAVGGGYNKFFASTKHIGAYEKDSGQYDNINYSQVCDYVVGASMFVSMRFVNEVGLMNEEYFLYFEELDWTFRGKKHGWTIGFFPDGRVWHKEGASIGAGANGTKSDKLDWLLTRNKLLFTKLNLPRYYSSIMFSLFIRLIIRVLKLQFSKALGVFRIIVADLKGIKMSNNSY